MDAKYHLKPRSTTLSSPQRTDPSLNVILLQECFLKTFIDIMLFSLLFYVFTFLFYMYRLLFTAILSRLTSCNYVAVCQPLLKSYLTDFIDS